MIPQHFDVLKGLINSNYAAQAEQARNSRSRLITSLLTQRRLPDDGWDEALIQLFLDEIASFDMNNFQNNVGVGEREGRVICDLVRRRHFGLTHGIGRSGDVMAEQPKAAGSSLLVQLTKFLALDAIHIAGVKAAKTCCVLPTATGLTMTLVFLALKQMRPRGRYIVWSRIDQKSCFKAIGTAGLTPIVIELKPIEGTDALGTDIDSMRAAVARVTADEVLCICTTTSTFAPRVPDSVDEVAALAAELGVPHVVNNAYGLQCSKCTHMIETGCRRGRIDAFVQSTDKNFLVPVGGAIVAAPEPELVDKISNIYPGRASMSPLLDLLITLLSLGAKGWKALLQERKENAAWFQQRFAATAEKHGLHLLRCPANRISFVVNLSPLAKSLEGKGMGDIDHLTFLGSALFTRRVSGPRVVVCAPPACTDSVEAKSPQQQEGPLDRGEDGAAGDAARAESAVQVEPQTASVEVKGKYIKKIDGTAFQSYGAHANTYPYCYLTAACAIGSTRAEMESFLERFEHAIGEYRSAGGRK